tara:strand:- start:56 stop:289 length:234 start_codon:yes stop_codon:yes gene_type:complete
METIDLVIIFFIICFTKCNKKIINKETQTEKDTKDKNLETELTSLEIEGLLQYKEDIDSINLNKYRWKFLNIINYIH